MKKLLFLTMILTCLLSVSCTKRVEGILRENPKEVSMKEAGKLLDYYTVEFNKAQSLLEAGDTEALRAYLKSPEWQLAERCHTMLTQLPPELSTRLNIAAMQLDFIDFVNKVISQGIPLRELPEE